MEIAMDDTHWGEVAPSVTDPWRARIILLGLASLVITQLTAELVLKGLNWLRCHRRILVFRTLIDYTFTSIIPCLPDNTMMLPDLLEFLF